MKNIFHVHTWNPIACMYISFNTRDVIWECYKCKKRELKRETRSFGSAFSMKTSSFLSKKEFKEILNGSPIKNYPSLKL